MDNTPQKNKNSNNPRPTTILIGCVAFIIIAIFAPSWAGVHSRAIYTENYPVLALILFGDLIIAYLLHRLFRRLSN